MAEAHRGRALLPPRAAQRASKLAKRLAKLVVADRAPLGVEVSLGAEGQEEAEEPLDHPLVDLPDQVDPLREPPGRLALDRRLLNARGQCREAPEREHRLSLVPGQLEPAAPTVGEDHAEPAHPEHLLLQPQA